MARRSDKVDGQPKCNEASEPALGAAADPSSPSLRRRGQLSLWVQVAAIRLSHASCQQLCLPPTSLPKSHKYRFSPSPVPQSKKRLLPSGSSNCREAREAGDAVKEYV
ncbi:unnamed protein product [Hydatigera taeniaeformis]|uniref:Uncharacterized protein n=1 Tax=Hydatigena taeniaeformis TaxID=6205 RepID=A0A0R3WR58_HYDTA|nr:unnamed protein product [Hydatigera taeniaeformis]